MITKKPIICEILGLPEVGKSDFCSKIKNSSLVDLTWRNETDIIFAKNRTEKEFEELYYPVENFNGILRFIRELPDTITTVCFDGSANLLGHIEEHWCKENNRKQALQVEYGKLYEMLNNQIIKPIIKRPANIVFTSGLKEEYIGGVDEKGRTTSVKTGKKVPQGINPMMYIRDIGINLYYDEEGHRANKILKNRFVSRTILNPKGEQIDNPAYLKSLIPEANWETLINAICVPGSAMRKEWVVQ